MKNSLRVVCLLTLALVWACGGGPALAQGGAPDYSEAGNWLAAPAEPDLPVDVFYLYSDSCSSGGSSLCAAGDSGMRNQAEKWLASQAGAFETVGNIYAPLYRQADTAAFLKAAPDERIQLLAGSVADTVAAFDYYFKNFNNGRPFILAAHSQGSLSLLYGVLANYLKTNPEAHKLMVAAYCPGYSVTSDYLSANPHLRFAQRADDLGVIISYTTESPKLKDPNPVVLPRSVAINPVLWTRSERPAKADLSQGANLAGFGGEDPTPAFADAKVSLKRGVVECSTADPKQYGSGDLFPAGVLHSGDFAFYYYDLRKNAQERAEAFQRKMAGNQ